VDFVKKSTKSIGVPKAPIRIPDTDFPKMSRFLFPRWSNALLPFVLVVGAIAPLYGRPAPNTVMAALFISCLRCMCVSWVVL
jgi:hypothetical protein